MNLPRVEEQNRKIIRKDKIEIPKERELIRITVKATAGRGMGMSSEKMKELWGRINNVEVP